MHADKSNAFLDEPEGPRNQPVRNNVEGHLAVLFQAKPRLVDALGTLSGKISTHTDGKAYDRILVSEVISKGLNRLKLERVVIQQHRHGKGEERRSYTDHFPVVAILWLGR